MNAMFLPPRIARKLDQILERKLTIIEAAAGYGKSTFLRRWLEQRKFTCLWYDLGKMPHAGLRERLLQDIHLHLKPLIWVFDNWHQAANSQEILQIISSLLPSTPTHLHFLLCTRSAPSLPNPHEALILDENTLALESQETSSLMARTFGVILSLEQTKWLQELTEGWIKALAQAGKTMAAKAGSWNPDSIAGKLREELFPYFETEFWKNLPPARQKFLLTLALPAEISPQILGPLLAPEDYGENLEWAAQNHIFLLKTPASPPGPEPKAVRTATWRFHPLFQEFLRSQLVQNHALHQSLTSKLGRLYLEQGRPQTAIPYLIQAGLYSEAAAPLEELLPTFADNRLETCASLLALFPPETEQHLPNALLAFGEELVQAGRNTEALSWLRRAAQGFGQLGNDWGITRALCAMGTAYTALGLSEEAEAVYRQAQDEATADSAKRAVVLSYLARCRQAAGAPDTDAGIPRLRLYSKAAPAMPRTV